MFMRMLRGTLLRQWKKMLMIAFTIALGASLCTAMLSVVLDVKDKVNQELKAYGANITVVPKQASILNDLYEVEGETSSDVYLKEEELGNIKTIFCRIFKCCFKSSIIALSSSGLFSIAEPITSRIGSS